MGRQGLERVQDRPSPVGYPDIPHIVRPGPLPRHGGEQHVFMVPDQQDHVGAVHHVTQDVDAVWTPVDGVSNDVEHVVIRQADLVQHVQEPGVAGVHVGHHVSHGAPPVSTRGCFRPFALASRMSGSLGFQGSSWTAMRLSRSFGSTYLSQSLGRYSRSSLHLYG